MVYGKGGSRVNEEGTPFKIVLESSCEIQKVVKTPRITVAANKIAERKLPPKLTELPTKNIVIIEIKIGKRPLHGTKLFVKIAINYSLGEFIMRVPTIPAALQPNPIHMVKACLPQAPALAKYLSKLKATRGK